MEKPLRSKEMKAEEQALPGQYQEIVPFPFSSESTNIQPITSTKERICQVCGAIGAHLHYKGLTCPRCRVFFIRCSRLRKPYLCESKGDCPITSKGSNCPACRLKKCVAIGMKMEDVGMTRKCSRNVVGYIDGWETVKQINNYITDLTAYGPKGIQCLMGAKTATEYATIYAHYGQVIDCVNGPSPSTTSITLSCSILDVLLNPLICSSRSTACMDQMATHPTNPDFKYRFHCSYARVVTSFADFITAIPEFHDLEDSDKLRLMQFNFNDYMVQKAAFTKYRLQQSHEVLISFLGKQVVEGAPDDFMSNLNGKMFSVVNRSIETIFEELTISDKEFVLLISIGLVNAPLSLSDLGMAIIRRARKRLIAILTCFIEENYPEWSPEERKARLQKMLQMLTIFKEIGVIFGHGITQLVARNWGKMYDKLAIEFHLKQYA